MGGEQSQECRVKEKEPTVNWTEVLSFSGWKERKPERVRCKQAGQVGRVRDVPDGLSFSVT